MIKFTNVVKSYNGKVNAVDQLNLEIKDGEIFGFLGPNGAGKTTTIKMLTGITNLDSGEILIKGLDINKETIKAKMEIGYVPDNPDLFLQLKGIEYLNFMASFYQVDADTKKSRIESITKDLGIYENLNDKILSYSHGMRQKIVITGALLHNPAVWILDEPLTGLDPKSAYILKEMMHKHVKSGNSVFFSTHVLDVAEKLCDRIGIISKGKLLFVGTIEELKAKMSKEQSLEDLFLELTENV